MKSEEFKVEAQISVGQEEGSLGPAECALRVEGAALRPAVDHALLLAARLDSKGAELAVSAPAVVQRAASGFAQSLPWQQGDRGRVPDTGGPPEWNKIVFLSPSIKKRKLRRGIGPAAMKQVPACSTFLQGGQY